LIIGAKNTQVSDLIGVLLEPGSAGLFEPRVEDMTMAGLDAA
jgi:hypothetical protein